MSTRAKTGRRRKTALASISDEEIDQNLLLTQTQKRVCAELRDVARKERRPFMMLDFARIALRATAREFTYESDRDGADTLRCDQDMRRAAALYIFEELGDALTSFLGQTDERMKRDQLLVASQLNAEQIGHHARTRKRKAPERERK